MVEPESLHPAGAGASKLPGVAAERQVARPRPVAAQSCRAEAAETAVSVEPGIPVLVEEEPGILVLGAAETVRIREEEAHCRFAHMVRDGGAKYDFNDGWIDVRSRCKTTILATTKSYHSSCVAYLGAPGKAAGGWPPMFILPMA